MKRLLIISIPAIGLLALVSAKPERNGHEFYENIQSLMVRVPADSITTRLGIYDTIRREIEPGRINFKSGNVYYQERTIEQFVPSFYISATEVTNTQYLEYLYHLRMKGRWNEHEKALPDTLVFREKLSYSEPYTEHYLRHPAYRDHPVVGITYEQAEKYCSWLTEQYLLNAKRKFKQVKFRLPSKNEWVVAARAGDRDALFPWKGSRVTDSKGKYIANFRAVHQGNLIIEEASGNLKEANDKLHVVHVGKRSYEIEYPKPVKCYPPNKFGLYDMAGNAEEYVIEKGITKGGSWKDTGYYLRINVDKNYGPLDTASSTRGFRFVMEVLK
jgi:formylglycine-generating enzyme required for sulfatase activity